MSRYCYELGYYARDDVTECIQLSLRDVAKDFERSNETISPMYSLYLEINAVNKLFITIMAHSYERPETIFEYNYTWELIGKRR